MATKTKKPVAKKTAKAVKKPVVKTKPVKPTAKKKVPAKKIAVKPAIKKALAKKPAKKTGIAKPQPKFVVDTIKLPKGGKVFVKKAKRPAAKKAKKAKK